MRHEGPNLMDLGFDRQPLHSRGFSDILGFLFGGNHNNSVLGFGLGQL